MSALTEVDHGRKADGRCDSSIQDIEQFVVAVGLDAEVARRRKGGSVSDDSEVVVVLALYAREVVASFANCSRSTNMQDSLCFPQKCGD
jgi:hypothetical protein